MSTSHALDRHTNGSVGHYCIRLLRGSLELDFPGRTIETPTAPAMVGPLIVLALSPRRPLAVDTFKTALFDYDPSEVTTGQIQTPISRLRLAGLPIPSRQYLLDVAPSDVDVVDFDHRAKQFIDRCVHSDRVADDDIERLIDEGYELHRLWQEDPGVAVGNNQRLYALFERNRRRNRRFGEVLVRLLVRAGERDRAGDVLYEYVDRYGTDEILQDLELEIRTLPRPPGRDAPAHGVVLLPGPVAKGAALSELWDRVAASTRLEFAELAVSAHNLDRIYAVDTVAVDHESRVRGVPVEAAGGAGANTAFALGRLGHRVAVAGMIADDRYGALLRQSLDLERVDCSNLNQMPSSVDDYTGHTLIFSDPYGRRHDMVVPGVNERYAQALRDDKSVRGGLVETARQSRLLNLSSFTSNAERRLQEDLLGDISAEAVVTFEPGGFYAHLGLDRLAPLILRCDVLNVYEPRLRQLVDNSSADTGGGPYSIRAALEALFRWRAVRIDRPLVVVVKKERHRQLLGEVASEDYDMITIAVGRSSVEDLVSAHARASAEPLVAEVTGQGEAIAAGIHLGLLSGAPLDECADLAFVYANEANSEIGARAGLPRRSTVAAAWAKYFPGVDLPAWVPRD
jgi:sugar/nucleoside kinase (ribokinase family)